MRARVMAAVLGAKYGRIPQVIKDEQKGSFDCAAGFRSEYDTFR